MSSKTYTEEEIQDLSDRVFLLKERLKDGKIHVAAHLAEDFNQSWSAVRLSPNGLVDPNTVDGRIRCATLAIKSMKYREDTKIGVSLAQIQDAYFTILFRELGWLYEKMINANATPEQVAKLVGQDPKFVEQIVSILPAFAEHLKEFWQAVGEAGAFHLQDGQQLKATFGGDIFPGHWENAVSTAGLYIDTIVLPCPITRIAPLIKVIPGRKVVSMLVKHTLTAMSYRDVAIAEVAPPIVLVLPNTDDVEIDSRQHLIERSEPAMLKHAEYLFGRCFESLMHLRDFCDSLTSIEGAMAELKGADRLLFDTEWDRDPRAQLTRNISARPPMFTGADQSVAGHHILGACLGRMPQAKAVQENARHFGGTPLINAETSWLYYTWMLEYEAATSPLDRRQSQSMHVARALVAESPNNLTWLGKVPPETVLEIRKHGLADEIRAILGHGIADLIAINPNNYFRTADQVIENLDRAFCEHQKALLDAKQKKLKLYGFDIGSFLVTGTLAVTAALTASPKLGAISGFLGIVGLPNLKDIKSKFAAITAEDRARKISPTGLLFRHVKKRT